MNIDLSGIFLRLYAFFGELSQKYGPTGDTATDTMIVIVLLSLFVVLIAILSVIRRSGDDQNGPSFDLGRGVMGRLEKLEMTLNALKTDLSRTNQLNKSDLGYLKQEVQAIKRLMGAEPIQTEEEKAYSVADDFSAVPSALDETAAEETSEARPAPEIEGTDAETQTAEKKTLELENSLSSGLARTRQGFLSKIRNIFGGKASIDSHALDELEEALVTADIGIDTATALINELKADMASGKNCSEDQLLERIKTKIAGILSAGESSEMKIVKPEAGPFVILVVGVNGVGKTTTTAKLASKLKAAGKKILIVAADTFRAAAVAQLKEWGERIDVPVVFGAADAKPATVVFDGMKRAKDESIDVVLIDTAGRLHTKSNLMQELEGVLATVKRHQADGPHEVLLVVDGATGQNALSQAREFHQSLKLTGVIVTKLDGTPKGGIVVAIKKELGIPVRYIGVGESPEDLRVFEPEEFVAALFDETPGEFEGSFHGELRREKEKEKESLAAA